MARKKQPKTPNPPSSETLALSELHLRAEALEKEHEKLLQQIKRKRTELNNFVEQMRSVATEMFHRGTPAFEKLREIDREIHTLFDEIFTTKKLGKQTQKNILEIYRTLQLAGVISPKSEESEENPELDEFFEDNSEEDDFFNSRNSYSQHQTSPTQESARTPNSRKIRQTFLRLAEIFHPDKVTDSETQMRHTEIMKELNKAYQAGDLARLLEIERQHQIEEAIENFSENDLERKCQSLEQHNSMLKNQYESLKRELRTVKNTSSGVLVSEYRQAVRAGINPIEQMLAEVEQQIEIVEEIRTFLRDFLDKKMTIKEFLKGPACMAKLTQDIREKIIEEMLGFPVTIVEF